MDMRDIEKPALSARDMTFGDRIKMVIEQKGVTKKWLAGQIGITKQSMNYLLNHASRAKHADRIARALGINPEWLINGTGAQVVPPSNHLASVRVQVLSRQAILDGATSNSHTQEQPVYLHPDDEPECQYIIGDHSLPERVFAFILDSTSMEPTFRQGSTLIFDPTRSAQNGDYVLVTLDESRDLLFRQVFFDGGDVYFNAVNPGFRNVVNQAHNIVGVVIESRLFF